MLWRVLGAVRCLRIACLASVLFHLFNTGWSRAINESEMQDSIIAPCVVYVSHICADCCVSQVGAAIDESEMQDLFHASDIICC